MLRAKSLRVCAPRLCLNSQSGLSYIEVLIATILVAVSLVPAVEALRSGIFGAGLHQAAAVDHYELRAKMEEVLAQPYALLDAAALAAGSETMPTSYSDSAGASRRRVVYMSRYDPSVPGYTTTDSGLLWVRVEFESRTGRLETLTAR
jgi:type II secretory pathway component PulJ